MLRSADPRLQVLPSFRSRARRRLAELSRLLVALLRTEDWDSLYVQQVLLEHRYLGQGLRTLVPSCPLTLDEQRYIVERLLPMIPETSAEGEFVEPTEPDTPQPPQPPAPTNLALTFDTLDGKVRGQAEPLLLLTGEVRGTVPATTELVVLRDGTEIYRQPAVTGVYQVSDAAPGLHYVVQLSNTRLRREQVRPLYSPILVGVASAGTAAAALPGLLVASYPGIEQSGIGRFTTTGYRKRIYVAVPASLGVVSSITQPDDNDAELLEAFTFTDLTLDFGADGAAVYHVGYNHANYIGTFTFDLHVTTI